MTASLLLPKFVLCENSSIVRVYLCVFDFDQEVKKILEIKKKKK